ncbi:MAG: InlB B-repeat-containing protein, partial [Alphaproteobacteria bacterium]|nr:InlB B-repeat-containing protein [Alphaproteobacteria bacterium]
SDNNATANTIATWDLIDYTLDPGEYLKVTDTSVTETTCPAGSYCVGGGYTVETANNSIAQCPAEYPNSAEGAGADTQCYTACTVDMVAKATAVTGNDYYGSGVDTCEPTACVAGWHVKPGLNLTDTIGTTDAGTGYTSNDYAGDEYDSSGIAPSDAGIAGAPMAFATAHGDKGMITGHGRCSTQAGVGIFDGASTPEDITVVNTLADETGAEGAQYCYCQVDGFTPTGGDKVMVTSAPWVFRSAYGSADYCASFCAYDCAVDLQFGAVDSLAFRAAVLNASSTSATCVANTINIDWNPDNNGAHIKNMCTYEGAIEVPADPVKPGYTFTGWKLVEENTTE